MPGFVAGQRGGVAVQPSFPAGVTLVPIDGGSSYYNDNGWTYAVTAGFDNSNFFSVEMWPAYLQTSTKFNFYNDLYINTATNITSDSVQNALGINANQSNVGANGLNPWGGIWVGLSMQSSALSSWFSAIGNETVILNVFDEPGNWVSDVKNYINGTSGTPLTGSKAVGRPFWVTYLNSFSEGQIGSTPLPTTPAASIYSTTTDPAGNTRSVNLIGSDLYWIGAASDHFGTVTPGGHFGNIYQLGGYSFISGQGNNLVSDSISVPTSFPTNISFTTTAGLGVAIGTPCLLNRGAGGSYSSILGTVTAYNSTTGSTTISVAQNNTYTCTVTPGGTIGNGSGGTTTLALNKVAISGSDGFIACQALNSPGITDVTSAGRIPGGTTVISGDALTFNSTNTNTINTITLSANTTIQAGDALAVASTVTTGGAGPFSSWVAHFGITSDQCRRGCRYGDWVDVYRGYQYSVAQPPNPTARVAAPQVVFVETMGPFQNQQTLADYITPAEMNQAAWSTIIHGARRLNWFNQTFGGPNLASAESAQSSYGTTIQGSNTISIYDQLKVTNTCVYKLAKVLNSEFAFDYVTISPRGYAAPWPKSYVQNDTQAENTASTGYNGSTSGALTISSNNGLYNHDLATVDGAYVPSFEVMAKYYTGATSSPLLTQNKFYIFSAYRGSGADTSKTATFTIAYTGSTTVTRIYLDIVNGAASSNSGTTTRIQVSDTSQMVTGDTAVIENTSGITGLNGTYTITVIDSTHVDLNLAWPGGALGSTHGTVLTTHNLTVTSGTTFSDTWNKGTDVRIYRVN